MNVWDVVVGLLVAAVIALAVRRTVRDRRSGGCGCGCSGCAGGCAGCSDDTSRE